MKVGVNKRTGLLYLKKNIDQDDHDVYFYVDWGDDNFTEWDGPYHSGFEAGITHTWSEEGTYIIKAKAMDELGDESGWATLEIAMPVNQQITTYSLFQRILERFPNASPVLRMYLGY